MAIKINVVPTLVFEKEVLKKLEKHDVRYQKNLHPDPDAVLAGTEIYDKKMINPSLKCISRIGSGTDNIDYNECDKRGVSILTTKEECANAVAEFAICQIYNALRKPNEDSLTLGRELKSMVVGVIGDGHIGSIVYDRMNKIAAKAHAFDIKYKGHYGKPKTWIFENCDIISIHIPLRERDINNYNFINHHDLNKMKSDAIIVNTSRGGIINEKDLYKWLQKNPSGTAVIDTFENEPYDGELLKLKNVIATKHVASFTMRARYKMETQAAENILNALKD